MAPDSLTTETLVAHTSDCTLTVKVTPTAEALHLHYQIRNTASRPLYLLNQLWENAWRDTTRNQLIFYALPNLANVEASSEAVTVSKKVVDVPPGLLVEARRIPLMTRVAPGAEYAETVVLPLPLQLNNMYQSGPLNVPAVPRPLYFELGYLPSEPAETAIREVATPEGSAFGTNAFPASEQAIITVGPFGQSFQVLADERPAPASSNGQWTPWG
ncbi:hypothetical protein [Hymenobacter negativus]|uniref:Uncharacterized protein n=1 Tax=Hymenobacter negativus TaxID=2795026 RepID=A0ABS3QF92_9BACT|nr:hypothetical protein [Hymenobacter negativus]MBO2009920.1 hypothetical protein [Hymenobacter negativus]